MKKVRVFIERGEDGTFGAYMPDDNGLDWGVVGDGATIAATIADFHEAVDDYLLTCEQEGIAPEVPYKGSFNVRIAPSLHERLARYAISAGRSLNSCVQEAIERYVATEAGA